MLKERRIFMTLRFDGGLLWVKLVNVWITLAGIRIWLFLWLETFGLEDWDYMFVCVFVYCLQVLF